MATVPTWQKHCHCHVTNQQAGRRRGSARSRRWPLGQPARPLGFTHWCRPAGHRPGTKPSPHCTQSTPRRPSPPPLSLLCKALQPGSCNQDPARMTGRTLQKAVGRRGLARSSVSLYLAQEPPAGSGGRRGEGDHEGALPSGGQVLSGASSCLPAPSPLPLLLWAPDSQTTGLLSNNTSGSHCHLHCRLKIISAESKKGTAPGSPPVIPP